MLKSIKKMTEHEEIYDKIKYCYGGYDSYMIYNMEKVVERVIKSVDGRKNIILYGYYDVDSVTSISMLILVLRYLNAHVEYFIPSETNYNQHTYLRNIAKSFGSLGTDLVICVGNGDSLMNEVKIFNEIGIDTILIENTNKNRNIESTYIINPNNIKSNYPFKYLSRSGVTFKFIEAISDYYDISYFYKYIDLSMLGTLCSGVDLIDENRTIVDTGINYLEYTNNHGIKALMKIHNIKSIDIATISELGKTIIPTRNIVGKMENARIIIELFTTCDYLRAEQIAKYLFTEKYKDL